MVYSVWTMFPTLDSHASTIAVSVAFSDGAFWIRRYDITMPEKSSFRVTWPSKLTVPVRALPLDQTTNQDMAHAANRGSALPQYAAE